MALRTLVIQKLNLIHRRSTTSLATYLPTILFIPTCTYTVVYILVVLTNFLTLCWPSGQTYRGNTSINHSYPFPQTRKLHHNRLSITHLFCTSRITRMVIVTGGSLVVRCCLQATRTIETPHRFLHVSHGALYCLLHSCMARQPVETAREIRTLISKLACTHKTGLKIT